MAANKAQAPRATTSTTTRKPKARKKTPSPPRTYPVRIMLGFMADGEAKMQAAFEDTIEEPPEGHGVQINIPLDARSLQQALEAALGPVAKSPLWTPNARGPLPLIRRD